jgi:desulfoferrodoxin (superoxide reductase-like protein)
MNDDFSSVIKSLNTSIGNLTQEFLLLKESVNNIEQNVCEIEVENGDGLPKTMKTNHLLKYVYLQTKEGGIIDQKFSSYAANVQKQITTCKREHNPTNQISRFNGLISTWGKGVFYVWMIILSVYVAGKLINIEKIKDTASQTVEVTK